MKGAKANAPEMRPFGRTSPFRALSVSSTSTQQSR